MSDELEVKAEEIVTAPETAHHEAIPSMEEFEEQISKSLHKIEEGELVKGTVIGISETEVTLDLGYYAEGIIPLEELSNDPRFSIKGDVTIGEEFSAVVIREDDGKGNILLSKKEADNVLSWTALKEYLENKTILKVKIAQEVNGGVTTYLLGIRGFIPASQLSLTYVEDLSSWVNKEVDVQVITVDEDKKKLVLSAKEVEKEQVKEEKLSKISHLPIGLVTKGTVEKLAPYGAFVNLGNGLSGLVHISQIANKRLKTPGEVLKEGQEVTVKIIEVKDGKISLSIKAVEEKAEISDSVEAVPFEYSSGEEASTGLAGLLSKFKLPE
jgi:small subunit ribosomal protein S1